MTRTRLLKVVPTLMCGGTENQFMALGRLLDRSRFDVAFACLRRWGPFVDELGRLGIPLHEYQVATFRSVHALAQQAQYSRHMADYQLTLALPAGSPERIEIAQKAIDYLKQFDNADSTVQPVVRLRIAKLNMSKGDFEAAKKSFASLITPDPNDPVSPEPAPFQQWEARYFNAVTDVLANKPAGLFDDYRRDAFEGLLAERFLVHRQETLPGGTRTIYLVEPKP